MILDPWVLDRRRAEAANVFVARFGRELDEAIDAVVVATGFRGLSGAVAFTERELALAVASFVPHLVRRSR